MDARAMNTVSKAVNCTPLRFEAAPLCHVAKDGLYWCSWEFSPSLEEFLEHRSDHTVVRCSSPPTSPSYIEPGWSTHADFPGRFPCVTGYRHLDRPCKHPVGMEAASDEAKERWREDGFATDLHHYEDPVLLWPMRSTGCQAAQARCFKSGGRLASAVELEIGMGFKKDFTKLDVGYQRSELYQHRRNALGKSLAVPVATKLLQSLLVVNNFMPAGPLPVSTWTTLSGKLPFPPQNGPLADLRDRAENLANKYTFLTDSFNQFLRAKGVEEDEVGADPAALNDKVKLAALSGLQRGTHLNKHRAELLVEHSGSETDHIKGALACQSPFEGDALPALDLDFGSYLLKELGSEINDWRARQLDGLRALAEECKALDAIIKGRAHSDTLRVTHRVNIGLILVLTRLLHWPDWALADRFLWGFPLAGVVPQCNLYGPAKENAKLQSLPELLGPDADAWNVKVAKNRRIRDTDSQIRETTRLEQAAGKMSRDLTKREVDKVFGKGSWRAIRRHCIWQRGKGKYRNIDDAKAAGTNLAAIILDTIHTAPFDQAVIILKNVRATLGRKLEGDMEMGLSTDDQKDAYHSIPNLVTQLGLAVVAFLNEQGTMVFTIAYGHVFGLRAAVTNYNRVPEFGIAITRRVLGCMLWHYFDDI